MYIILFRVKSLNIIKYENLRTDPKTHFRVLTTPQLSVIDEKAFKAILVSVSGHQTNYCRANKIKTFALSRLLYLVQHTTLITNLL